jgi:hypothetical protein
VNQLYSRGAPIIIGHHYYRNMRVSVFVNKLEMLLSRVLIGVKIQNQHIALVISHELLHPVAL